MSRTYPAALFLPGDAFDTDRNQVMGRRVAGSGFVHGIASSLINEELTVIVSDRNDFAKLRDQLQPCLESGSNVRLQLGLSNSSITNSGCVHLPDPGLAHWSWLRAGRSSDNFSITGVTHTLCSRNVMSNLEQLITAPLEEWDALVCTSQAALGVVQEAMDCQREKLSRRFRQSLPFPKGPQLPVIPLAIDPTPYQWRGSFNSREDQRQEARQALQLPNGAIVVLFLGRLSFHSKAHPLPLYRSLAELSAQYEIILLECGHLFSDVIAAAFDELAKQFPSLSIRRLGGLIPASEEEKKLALAAADIFCSPADNLQETFGLSVLEAMASSLPVVVSDWNGYRDLVEPGVSGLLVASQDVLSSRSEADGIERDYRLGLMDYDTFVGLRSLGVCINHRDLIQALKILCSQSKYRREMGEKAQEQLEQKFSWSVVSSQYRELWNELKSRRQNAAMDSQRTLPWPTSHSGRLFNGYSHGSFPQGPWLLHPACTDAGILPGKMQRSFIGRFCPNQRLETLSRSLKKLQQQNTSLSSAELNEVFLSHHIAALHHSSMTATLLKLGILENTSS
ncbi:GDP-mannose-dependent alpha-(1-2)-phosphatidylinositol mannosyltransferase [Prochlorococcus marinus str. MIT 1342]|uniref:glycosyltransferase family 4 protein n=1 Tax=Prochlorococcus TaxID=1218 RepID=UPI0007B3DDB1|nr:glycosyltransferase family 4 protein [Prochlorococcus marinus]KZR79893.1 GDP-mannose-dependent alpha-(1-2)-phosphatidylinositol mannosyltransferase [Prochlorococcus marinus str. MIT 1342]